MNGPGDRKSPRPGRNPCVSPREHGYHLNRMGYKILGFAVWQGGKWYLRRRFEGASRKLAIAGLAGVLVAGAAVATQRARSD
jgi:hypothetical protein